MDGSGTAADPGDPAELLRRELPGLAVATVEPLGEGWDHAAYLVNGEFVFRLPWELVEGTGPVTPGRAAPEIGLLRAVAGRLPVAVPEPLFVAPDGSWFGYRYLPGTPVVDRLEAWTGERRRRALVDLVVEVALGIERLVPVDAAIELGLPALATSPHDPVPVRAGLGSGLVSPEVVATGEWALGLVRGRWEKAAARRMVTLHADFGLDHWLLGADGDGEVYALIDWSDACVAPPEHQVSTLMWDIPELADAAATTYAERTGVSLDGELIVADGCLNALGDLGELVAEDEPDDDDIQRCVRFLDTWSARRAR